MNDQQRKTLIRAQALQREGKAWSEVARILASEGAVNTKGVPYEADSLKAACSRLAKTLPKDVDGRRADRERKPLRSHVKVDRQRALSPDKVDTIESVTSDKVDRLTKEEMDSIMQRVESLIDEKIQAALGAGRAVASVPREDDPPSPPKTGKRLHGVKRDLRARIDKNLMYLLEVDCQTHYGRNMSKCLDAILWRYYDKPRLSFEP